jgi:hypothetical protein
MTDEARIAHAQEFLSSLNRKSETAKAMSLLGAAGKPLTAFLADYADASAEQHVVTLDHAKDVAQAMIVIGYALRCAEERRELEIAARSLSLVSGLN